MKKFLIVKPSSLGDILHAFPAVAALCREENARADWMVHPAFAGLLPYLSCVDHAILFERKKLGSIRTFLPEFLKLCRDLRQKRYDAVIDLQGLSRSAFFGRIARSKIYAGPADPKEIPAKLFYNRRLSSSQERHALLRNNQAITSFLQTDNVDFSFTMPVLKENLVSAKNILKNAGVPEDVPMIGLAPGARWITKQWPPEFFAAIIERLAKTLPDAVFLLFGSGSDAGSAVVIREKCTVPERTFDLCGKTSLGELVELTRLCRLLICNDSGPMHIAAALDTPVLAMFGPTFPERTGPFTERKTVLQPEIDCLRCFQRKCEKMSCHTGIAPDRAAEAALMLLKN